MSQSAHVVVGGLNARPDPVTFFFKFRTFLDFMLFVFVFVFVFVSFKCFERSEAKGRVFRRSLTNVAKNFRPVQ